MDRRAFLRGGAGGIGALGMSALSGAASASTALFDPLSQLERIRSTPDRLFRITVCLRPFRAKGPRIEAEQVGRKKVVHNYGHGGSGWSLSWGSAIEAVTIAMEDGATDIAVIGAGALGLTAAITAQKMGASVTIYAKEQFPYVRSARATGSWTPDSRVAFTDAAGPDFPARWEKMARAAFAVHQGYLGLPGNPVEWTDRYMLSDTPPMPREAPAPTAERPDTFAHLEHRLRDITPRSVDVPADRHPFRPPYLRRNSQLTFNVADLMHQLTADFLMAGGKIVPTEFHEVADIAKIRQKVVINCTGYGARALWEDESIVPVRGQIAWLIPQAGALYGIYYKHLGVVARRDGIVVQELGEDEWFGFNDASEEPDRAAAEASVALLDTVWPVAV